MNVLPCVRSVYEWCWACLLRSNKTSFNKRLLWWHYKLLVLWTSFRLEGFARGLSYSIEQLVKQLLGCWAVYENTASHTRIRRIQCYMGNLCTLLHTYAHFQALQWPAWMLLRKNLTCPGDFQVSWYTSLCSIQSFLHKCSHIFYPYVLIFIHTILDMLFERQFMSGRS